MPLSWHVKRAAVQAETVKWGLWNVAVTTRFLNEEAKSIHGNLRMDSVFTAESGEWKLAGFEVLSALADDEPFIYVSSLGGCGKAALMGERCRGTEGYYLRVRSMRRPRLGRVGGKG